MTSYLIRDAYLLTMDGEASGTLETGDVAIDGDRIAAVGPGLDGAGAEVIDGRGMIAMPGLVDTHRHMWAAMLRGGACYGTLADYFGTVVFTYGAAFTPEDTYRSVRFGLAESVDGGITTIHAWEHNIQTPDHARAAVQALRESGMRGRFSYGSSSDPSAGSSFVKGDETVDFDDILRLRDEEFANPDGRLHLGIAARGHEFSREHIWKQEFAWAREHGLPITAHCMMTDTTSKTAARFRSTSARACSAPICCSSTASASTMKRSTTSPARGRPCRSRSCRTCAAAWACRRCSR